MSDNEKFKLFSRIIKENKTNPTLGESLVQEAPYVTKEGNGFNTVITTIDRAFYKPQQSNPQEYLDKVYTESAGDEH